MELGLVLDLARRCLAGIVASRAQWRFGIFAVGFQMAIKFNQVKLNNYNDIRGEVRRMRSAHFDDGNIGWGDITRDRDALYVTSIDSGAAYRSFETRHRDVT